MIVNAATTLTVTKLNIKGWDTPITKADQLVKQNTLRCMDIPAGGGPAQPKSMKCNNYICVKNTNAPGWIENEYCNNGCNSGTGTCYSSCTPGQKICDGSNSKTCKSDGTGYTTTTCTHGCYTEYGTCYPICTPGEKKCNGDYLITCQSNGVYPDLVSSWTNCEYGCNSGTSSCYSCSSQYWTSDWFAQTCESVCNNDGLICLYAKQGEANKDQSTCLIDYFGFDNWCMCCS